MAAIQLVAVAAALGWRHRHDPASPSSGPASLFVVIGNYLPKVRPNYMMGIRTPWTLTSDLAWDRTHRLGGRLFVLEGIVFILLGLVRPPAESFVVVLIGGIVADARVLFRVLLSGLEDRPATAGDMSDQQILLLALPVLLIELGLIVFAVRDLLKPERRVRGESKLMWGLIIVFISLLGPILYFVVGRREE